LKITDFISKRLRKTRWRLNGIESIRLTQLWTAIPTKHVINQVKELNSRESDYSPVFVGGRDNEIIFTTTRKAATGKRRSMITGQTYADLFRSQFNVQRQKWGEPQPIDQNFIVNTTDEEGAASLSGIGDQMIFTRCSYDKTRNSPPQLFGTSQVRGSWAEPNRLDIFSDSVMVAHPALSPDGSVPSILFLMLPAGREEKISGWLKKVVANMENP
jgi:peptidoglycan-associated lipoprotein